MLERELYSPLSKQPCNWTTYCGNVVILSFMMSHIPSWCMMSPPYITSRNRDSEQFWRCLLESGVFSIQRQWRVKHTPHYSTSPTTGCVIMSLLFPMDIFSDNLITMRNLVTLKGPRRTKERDEEASLFTVSFFQPISSLGHASPWQPKHLQPA